MLVDPPAERAPEVQSSSSCQVCNHALDYPRKFPDVFFARPIYHFCIYVEVVMAQHVPNAHHPFPCNLGIAGQQCAPRQLIKVFDPLTHGNQLHTNSIQLFQS